MAVIPAKQLITTITREGNSKATATGFTADQMGGQLRRIGEGFAVEQGQLRNQGTGVLCSECNFGVMGTEMCRHRSGIGRFIKASFPAAFVGEGDCETTDRPATASLHQSGD